MKRLWQIVAACAGFSVPVALALDMSYVDVFVGTGGLGHLSPAAAYPFGMVQAGPDTSASPSGFVGDWAHTSGYQFGDGYVFRFSQTHLFGTGCSSLGNIGLLPFSEQPTNGVYVGRMDKQSERALPGYYAVTIGGACPIGCEMTAKGHTASYRFRFGDTGCMRLLLDADWGVTGPANDRRWRPFGGRITSACEIEFADATSVSGRIRVADWVEYEVCFAMAFSVPVLGRERIRAADGLRGEAWALDFGDAAGRTLEVRLGLSANSVGAARRNLAAEMPDFAFSDYREESFSAWRSVLSRVELDAACDSEVAASLRSALYRLCLQPNDISDVGQSPFYSTFSLWDTYRATHPLYTILFPEKVDDFVNSLLQQYDRQGYLPIWPLWGKDTHCMIGHHSVPVIADAYLKGFRGFDAEKAFAAIRDSLTRSHRASSSAMWGLLKEDWDAYDRHGYVPFDGMSEDPGDGRKVVGESVSRTLECAYDDACAARFAAALGRKKDAEFFGKRAGNWRNVFDAQTGFMRGRDRLGNWRTPFSPYTIGHCWWQPGDFTEGNAWQWTWHVMHDPEGLVEALGGRSEFGRRLDGLFSADPRLETAEGAGSGDVSGLIGQYAHGNEPSHHTAYFFRWSDRPHRTDEIVRKVFETQYAARPNGLCGNDDCGQMAAWYVFSAMGFYPFNPCGGEYVIGAPQVPKVEIEMEKRGGQRNKFTVIAHGLSKENKYVKSVALNGRKLERPILRHADVTSGGLLEFEMTNRAEDCAR